MESDINIHHIYSTTGLVRGVGLYTESKLTFYGKDGKLRFKSASSKTYEVFAEEFPVPDADPFALVDAVENKANVDSDELHNESVDRIDSDLESNLDIISESKSDSETVGLSDSIDSPDDSELVQIDDEMDSDSNSESMAEDEEEDEDEDEIDADKSGTANGDRSRKDETADFEDVMDSESSSDSNIFDDSEDSDELGLSQSAETEEGDGDDDAAAMPSSIVTPAPVSPAPTTPGPTTTTEESEDDLDESEEEEMEDDFDSDFDHENDSWSDSGGLTGTYSHIF